MPHDICLLALDRAQIANALVERDAPIEEEVLQNIRDQTGAVPLILMRIPADPELQIVIDAFQLSSMEDQLIRTTLGSVLRSIFIAYATGWNAHLQHIEARGGRRQRRVNGDELLCEWTDRDPKRIHGHRTFTSVRVVLERIVSMQPPVDDEFRQAVLSAISNGWVACERNNRRIIDAQ